jgi:hypothetical protein
MPITDNLTDSQKMIVITNTILEQSSKLDKHHKVLIEGNGEKPLLERMRNVEEFISGIRFWQRTLAVALVLQTLTFGVSALVYFVRLYPLLVKLANQP